MLWPISITVRPDSGRMLDIEVPLRRARAAILTTEARRAPRFCRRREPGSPAPLFPLFFAGNLQRAVSPTPSRCPAPVFAEDLQAPPATSPRCPAGHFAVF